MQYDRNHLHSNALASPVDAVGLHRTPNDGMFKKAVTQGSYKSRVGSQKAHHGHAVRFSTTQQKLSRHVHVSLCNRRGCPLRLQRDCTVFFACHYRDHRCFFIHYNLPGPEDAVWTLGLSGECLNIFRGTRQVLMQRNKHVWSLFLHILPYSNQIRTENAAETLNCPFFTLDFSKQNGVGCLLSNVKTL